MAGALIISVAACSDRTETVAAGQDGDAPSQVVTFDQPVIWVGASQDEGFVATSDGSTFLLELGSEPVATDVFGSRDLQGAVIVADHIFVPSVRCAMPTEGPCPAVEGAVEVVDIDAGTSIDAPIWTEEGKDLDVDDFATNLRATDASGVWAGDPQGGQTHVDLEGVVGARVPRPVPPGDACLIDGQWHAFSDSNYLEELEEAARSADDLLDAEPGSIAAAVWTGATWEAVPDSTHPGAANTSCAGVGYVVRGDSAPWDQATASWTPKDGWAAVDPVEPPSLVATALRPSASWQIGITGSDAVFQPQPGAPFARIASGFERPSGDVIASALADVNGSSAVICVATEDPNGTHRGHSHCAFLHV